MPYRFHKDKKIFYWKEGYLTIHHVTLIPGDGIGPEVVFATKDIIDATGVKIKWDIQEAGESCIEIYGTPLPDHVIASIKKNKIALKGPITTPVGSGFRSVNVALRKELDLYANIRPAKTYPGIASRYTDIDLVIVRENTEDLYAGIERMKDKDTAESIKIVTRKGCERIVRFAFEFARIEKRKKVTAVHKANIMKLTDGLFLSIAREIAGEYRDISFEDVIVDALSMKLTQTPEQYDVIVTLNLYGDILSDLCAGLVGGLGVAPGANIGRDISLFEPVHGSAPKRAKLNMVNPTATIFSGIMLLKKIGETEAAGRIEKAIMKILKQHKYLTYDLGGKTSTNVYKNAIIRSLT